MSSQFVRRTHPRLISRVIRQPRRAKIRLSHSGSLPTIDIEDTDLIAQQSEILVLVWKREGVWRGLVQRNSRTDVVPPGPLGDVILAAQSTIFASAPIVLASVAHRDALRWTNIRLKVGEYTTLDADEILALIDAGAHRGQLDLSHCYIEHIDLSLPAIEQKWNESPDATSPASPLWKSVLTDGLKLEGALLRKIVFSDCQLQGVDLEDADLSGASLSNTDLQDARMNGANLAGASLFRTDLQRAELRATSFAGARVFETHFEDTNLFGSDWRGAMAMDSRFDRAYLADAHLEGADFYPLKPGALSGVGWSSAFLDRTRIRLEQLGHATREEVEAKTLVREVRHRGSKWVDKETLKG